MTMEITGNDSKINKLTNDKEVKIAPVNDLSVNTDNQIKNKSANATLVKDGTNLNASIGKIPASGFLLSDSETPSFVKNAEQVIQKYAGDSRKLQIIGSAFEKLNLNESIDNLTAEDMMAFQLLGIDLQMDYHGQIVITEISSGNEIKAEDFAKSQTNLNNTVKRTIANVGNNSAAKGPVAVNSQPTDVAQKAELAENFKTFETALKEHQETVKFTKEVVDPNNAKLEENIKKYEAVMAEIDKRTTKIDENIKEIEGLSLSAKPLMDKAKNGTITDLEKKQLLSIATILEMKKKEFTSNHENTELLMNQAEQTFTQFAPNLSEGDKTTKEAIQSTLKAKLSGQPLTVEQIGVDNIVKEIYLQTAGMSPEDLQDKDKVMKAMSTMNKFFDRIGTASKISDLSSSDLDTLWKDYKFKAVEENGKLEYYFYATDKADPVKVSKEDIRGFKTHLNNIVNSPELLQVARASGQISLAYDNNLSKKNVENIISNTTSKQDTLKVKDDDSINQKEKPSSIQGSTLKDEIAQKTVKWTEQSNMEKSFQRKKDEERYHEKMINNIHESRREINKYLDKKREEREVAKEQLFED